MAETPGTTHAVVKSAPATPTLKDLSNALDSVMDWHLLGVKLGIKAHELETIEKNYHGDNVRCKHEMLGRWLQNAKLPTWKAVADALCQMEKHAVASKIRKKHCSSATATDTGIPLAISLQNPSVAVAQHNITMIQGKFAILVTKSCKRLQNIREINIEDIQMFLITIYSSPNSKDGCDMVTSVVESAKSLREIFQALSKYGLWDYLNYSLLQRIIKEFAHDDKELNDMMEQYQQDLTGHILALQIQTYLDATHYKLTPVYSENLGDEMISALPPQQNSALFRKLTVKVKANVTDHTLGYVEDLWESLAKQFALPRPAMILHNIAEGCIGITWLIPNNLVKYVTRMAQETTSLFVEEHILRVMLEEQAIYPINIELKTKPPLPNTEPPVMKTDHRLPETEPPLPKTDHPLLKTCFFQLETGPSQLETELVLLESEPALLETESSLPKTEPPLLENESPLLETEHPLLETKLPLLKTKPTVKTELTLLESEPSLLETEHGQLKTKLPLLETNDLLLEIEAPLQDTEPLEECIRLELMQLQLAELEARVKDSKATLAAKEAEMNERERQIMEMFDAELQQKEAEIALVRVSMENQIRVLKEQFSTMLSTKEKQISTFQKSYQSIVSSKNELLSCKEDTIARYTATVQALHDQLAEMQRILSTKHQSHLMCPDAELMWRQCANLPAAITSTQAALVKGSIRGVEVFGEVELTIQSQGGSFEWKGYGFRVHVPEGSLPAGMSGCRIKIRASLSGQFQLPEDSDFISPVFWITAPCKFTKPVTLEIQHCALSEHNDATLSNLSFVSAKCSQKGLPYRFRQVDGGVFTLHSSYGSIQLSHFSGFGITGGKSIPRFYCAHLYHTKKQTYDWRYYFVITQDLHAKNMVVREHYDHFATKEASLRVRFVRSEITLDIPVDGLVTKEGWKITPLTFPTISRKDADQFQPGQWIPECQLIVQWKREDQRPVQLMHKVDLIGAKAPCNYFHLALNPAWEGAGPVPPRRMETDSEVDPEPYEKPNLVNLISFPGKSGSINIPQQISTKYFMFGVSLLNDETGAEVSAIVTKYHGDVEQINLEVLRLWIRGRGKPLSWNILIGVLKGIGLDTLASDIKNGRFPIPHHSTF